MQDDRMFKGTFLFHAAQIITFKEQYSFIQTEPFGFFKLTTITIESLE